MEDVGEGGRSVLIRRRLDTGDVVHRMAPKHDGRSLVSMMMV